MFFLELIPGFLLYLLIGLAVVILLASFLLVQIPFINKYALPAQVVSTVVLCFSLYSAGMLSEKEKYELGMKEAKAEIVRLKKASKVAVVANVAKTEEKIEEQKEKTKEIIKYVKVFVTKVDDSKCIINESIVWLHNYSAANTLPPITGIVQSGPTDVKISELLSTVTENYGTYYELREKYMGLRDSWIEQEKLFNDGN